MAISHDFDPANGFVALPSDVMDIDMSPGAFRLLVELCRMANRSGECWPSLGQLSERIGRSKAAISGYITELREIDLVQTLSQKMANGYNYRLKYCVVFWQKWRAQLSAAAKPSASEKNECSVQPSERRVNSKNHIQENQTTPNKKCLEDAAGTKLESVFLKWKALTKATNFPNFNAPAPSQLLDDTRNLLRETEVRELPSAVIQANLVKLWKKLNVDVNRTEIAQQTDVLVKRKLTNAGFTSLEKTTIQTWQKHWRKAPTDEQFAKMITEASTANREEGTLRMLEQYLRRWEISQNKLHRQPHSHSLSSAQAA